MKIIEIIVSPKGQTRVETKGFAGRECQQASRFVEEALGTNSSFRLTEEYYRSASVQRNIEQQR